MQTEANNENKESDEENDDTQTDSDSLNDIWQDFDIETLNFDKFIESNNTNDSIPSTSKEARLSLQQANSRKIKRKQQTDEDLEFLKSKRRVNYFISSMLRIL